MNKKGFTLVELLAVIAILAILVVIAMPNVIGMFNQAKVNTFVTDVQKIMDTAKSEFTMDSFHSAGESIYYSSVDNNDLNTSKLNIDSGGKDYFIEMDRHGDFKRVVIFDDSYCYDIYSEGTNSDLSGSNSKLILDKINKTSVLSNDVLLSGEDSLEISVDNSGEKIIYEIVGCNSYIKQVVPEGGEYIPNDGEKIQSGEEMPKKPQTGDQFNISDYQYHYNKRLDSSGNLIEDSTMNGWGVTLNPSSSRKTTFQEIDSYINNKPVVAISWLFGNGNGVYLEEPPVIPDTIKYMDGTFHSCIFAVKYPLIPDGVVNMNESFASYGWVNEVTVFPSGFKIPSSVRYMDGTFKQSPITVAPNIPFGVESLIETFKGTDISVAPDIPSSVKKLNDTFRDCDYLVKGPKFIGDSQAWDFAYTFADCDALVDGSSIVFPEKTENLNLTFSGCLNLETPPDLSKIKGSSEGVVLFGQMFMNCKKLTGNVTINVQEPWFASDVFQGTVLPITLSGTSPYLSSFARKYDNVTVINN